MKGNRHFIEFFINFPFLYIVPKRYFSNYLFFQSPFTPTDFQYIMVSRPVFSFHSRYTLKISYYS